MLNMNKQEKLAKLEVLEKELKKIKREAAHIDKKRNAAMNFHEQCQNTITKSKLFHKTMSICEDAVILVYDKDE